MTDESEFKFKETAAMNEAISAIKAGLAGTLGVAPEKIKCKGIRIFFVEEDSDTLLSSGLFVKGFSPEDWDDDE